MQVESMDHNVMADVSLDDVAMEDLFGETSGLETAVLPTPLPSALLLRLAELKSSGCCS